MGYSLQSTGTTVPYQLWAMRLQIWNLLSLNLQVSQLPLHSCRPDLSKMECNSISEIAGRGRCLLANRCYLPGDQVLTEEPYAMVVSEDYADVTCSYCCTLCAGGTMYALSADSSVRYCSEKCITADYPVLSLESSAVLAIEAAKVQGPGKDSMRLVLRIASIRKQDMSRSSSRANVPSDPYPLNGRWAVLLC
jgi:hypothetical protein